MPRVQTTKKATQVGRDARPTERPPLRIHLLGAPAVKWAGEPLAISRRQVRALLYRLAASPNPVPREQLCFLFWPDIPEAQARRKLTGLLAHLRRLLPSPEVLLTPDDHVGLDPDDAWSELRAFRDLLARRPADLAPEVLRKAVAHYRGPFLDGFSLPENPEYETWITFQRQTCERLYLEALAALVEEGIARGDYGLAITYAQRYLEADDLAEDLHRQLIALYAAVGERSAAMRQYEYCVAVLERELGVEPLPETREVYQTVLAGGSPLPAVLAPPAVPEVEPVWTTLPSLDVTLVGRDEPLLRLEETYARARAGQGAMVLISGELGVGKSRLVQDFAVGRGDEVLVLAGAGYRDTQMTPYQPLIEALRPALLARSDSLDVPAWCLAEASRLMPELRLLHADLPPQTEPDQARTRLFEALGRVTLALASAGRPLLLCLDDLHWADGTTLEWLAYLGRQMAATARSSAARTSGGAALLILGTYRAEDGSAVAELRRSLARQDLLVELELAGLDEAAVGRVLHSLEDVLPGNGSLAAHLQQITGGNPFFLLETLRAVVEAGCKPEELAAPAGSFNGASGSASEDGFCLADTVRDAVEAQVARLSARARQVLEAGAVLGTAFSFGLLRRTSGRREMETLDGLDELVARRLLEEASAGYRFRHEIIETVVYRQLSHWRQRVLHRRAAEALERLEPGNVTALAWHYERAGEPGQAARYHLQAGGAVQEVYAYVEAQAHFDRALALLRQQAGSLDEPEAKAANLQRQVEAFYGRGWALRLLGDMEAYAGDLEEVARLAGALDDPRTLAHLHWRQAYTHRWFCRFPRARAAAEDGIRLSQVAGDSLLEAMCRREVGLAARATGDYDAARAALELALDLFVGLGETDYEIHTLGNLSTLYSYEGEPDRALDLARQALARCDELGLPLQRRLPLGDMGVAAIALGDVELARASLEESLSIAWETADRTQEILCLGHLGWLALHLEQPEDALLHLESSLALAELIGSCTEQAWLLAGLAETHRLAGKTRQALEFAGRARTRAQETGVAYDAQLVGWVEGRLEGDV